MKISERIKLFFKEVIAESKKVDWPTRQETFKFTLLVLGISASVALFLGALDFVFVGILSRFII